MDFELKIQTDNAAFEDNPDELIDTLLRVIAKLQDGYEHGNIRDTNGNTIGWFSNLPAQVGEAQ